MFDAERNLVLAPEYVDEAGTSEEQFNFIFRHQTKKDDEAAIPAIDVEDRIPANDTEDRISAVDAEERIPPSDVDNRNLTSDDE